MRKKILLLSVFTFTVCIHSQSWQVVGNMPNSVYGAQAVVKGGSIYILGGFSEPNNSPTNKIQEYDPQKNSWKVSTKMNTARYDFIAGVYSDSIVYFGGVSFQSQNSTALEMWDLVSAPRIYDTNSIFNRLYATGRIINGKLYVFGGQTMGEPYLAIYDIASAKVLFSSDLSFGFQFPLQQMSVIIGNNIYLFGGTYGVLMNSIYKLNTSDNSFKKLSSEMDRPRAGGVAVSVGDTSIYIIGGFDETQHALSSVSVLKLNQEEVESEDGPPLVFPRADPIVVSYNNSIYVFGGLDKEGQPVNAIEKLDLITGVTDPKTTPVSFELENNYPNPFNPSTNIAFKVAKTSKVSLDIYTVLGQHVRNIASKVFSPGSYTFTWNGLDNSGKPLPSGIYIYKLTSDYFVDAKKMILLK